MQLYSYFRSTAAYRVRIALNLKSLAHSIVPVNLLSKQHQADGYTAINPQGLVPALALESGQILNQSLAIIEYLEDTHPHPALLPEEPWARAWVRGLAYEIACDMHPLNNLRVLKYLENELNVSPAAKQDWYAHWVATGFSAIETRLAQFSRANSSESPFCFGNTPTMADCLLVPQVYNAQRFNCDLQPYPLIRKIATHCLTLDAFANAHPDQQADAPAA